MISPSTPSSFLSLFNGSWMVSKTPTTEFVFEANSSNWKKDPSLLSVFRAINMAYAFEIHVNQTQCNVRLLFDIFISNCFNFRFDPLFEGMQLPGVNFW